MTAPRPKESTEAQISSYDDTKILSRMDTLEAHFSTLKDAVEMVKNTNWFVLAVLFIGFIALLFSLIGVILQANNANNETQIELIRSMDSLNRKIEEINPKPSTTPSQPALPSFIPIPKM